MGGGEGEERAAEMERSMSTQTIEHELAVELTRRCGSWIHHSHHQWVYVGCAILAPLAWMLLGVLYPLSAILGGACRALPGGGGGDDMALARAVVPPMILPMTRRLVESCLVTQRAAGASGDTGSLVQGTPAPPPPPPTAGIACGAAEVGKYSTCIVNLYNKHTETVQQDVSKASDSTYLCQYVRDYTQCYPPCACQEQSVKDAFSELQERYAAALDACPVSFCGLNAGGTPAGGGRPYMLDVVGVDVELVNHTFESFQLDKQINVKALLNVSMPTEQVRVCVRG